MDEYTRIEGWKQSIPFYQDDVRKAREFAEKKEGVKRWDRRASRSQSSLDIAIWGEVYEILYARHFGILHEQKVHRGGDGGIDFRNIPGGVDVKGKHYLNSDNQHRHLGGDIYSKVTPAKWTAVITVWEDSQEAWLAGVIPAEKIYNSPVRSKISGDGMFRYIHLLNPRTLIFSEEYISLTSGNMVY